MNKFANVRMILNYAWKAGIAFLGTGFLVIALLVWKESHGRSVWGDRVISKSVTARRYNDDTYRIYNVKTGKYTTGKIAWTSGEPQRDSISVYSDRDGYRGFFNALTGEITLNSKDFRFLRAWHFSEGKAFVQGENGKLGVIDYTGRLCIPFNLPFETGFDYVFEDGLCKIGRYDDGPGWKQGLLRSDGTWALPMEYSYISEPGKDGYRIVTDQDGTLLLDGGFNPVFDRHYDGISLAEEGGVYITDKHRKWLADYTGKVIQPFVFDSTHELYYQVEYHEDEADEYELDDDLMAYGVGLLEGLFNKTTGKILTSADYWSVTMVSKDVIRAQLNYAEGFVFLNRKGEVIEQ